MAVDRDEPAADRSLSFDEARERLRARGYLDGGVEGAVLKGALAARTRTQALLQAAAVAAAFLAAALAVVETAFVAMASALAARDTLVLFLWILAGALVVAGLAVLLLIGAALWRTRRGGDVEGMSTELGVAFGLIAGLGGALAARPALQASGPAAAAAIVLAVAGAVFVAMRVARGVAFTVLVASGRAILARRPTRGATLAAASAGLVLVGGAAFAVLHRAPPADEPLVATPNARRVVLVGIDGWSARYLPAEQSSRPASPALAYDKGRERDPAAFWTTVATGEPVRRHGVGSLDLVRVSGIGAPLQPGGGSRWFLGRLRHALHLARRESVTAAARRVPAMWEVARRAGVPSLVVNWWTTYPAGDSGGTVLSNHLFFAARAGRPLAGEGWPIEAAERAARLAPRVAPEPGTPERLVADAQGLDDFSVRAFRDAAAREKPRLMLLYLPGLDILASALAEPDRSTADRVALAAALTEEAGKLERLVGGGLAEGADLVALLLDGGRREGGGELRLLGPLARSGAGGTISPADVAPTLLAVLGVPASREIAGRVRADLLADGAAVPDTVASWGRRRGDRLPPVDPKEYVDNLKSLGYLK